MFGAAAAQAAAGDYAAAYGQGSAHPPQYGYGPQYTQWPDGNGGGGGGNSAVAAAGARNGQAGGGGGGGGYSYLGGGDDSRGTRDIQQNLETLKIGGVKKGDSNGYAGAASSAAAAPPKKMSWANVASQPAKPTPTATKMKKPGVLPPPAIIPSATKQSTATLAAAVMQQTGPPKAPQAMPAQAPSQDQGRMPKLSHFSNLVKFLDYDLID